MASGHRRLELRHLGREIALQFRHRRLIRFVQILLELFAGDAGQELIQGIGRTLLNAEVGDRYKQTVVEHAMIQDPTACISVNLYPPLTI